MAWCALQSILLSTYSILIWFMHSLFPVAPMTYPQTQTQSQRRAMDNAALTKRDRANENFTKATARLMKRCDQISRRYEADVYILVRRKHRHYEYNSADDSSFPPQPRDLVSLSID